MKQQLRAGSRTYLVRGLSSLLDISTPPRPRIHATREEAIKALRSDMAKIGSDMHRVIERERDSEEASRKARKPAAE